jgi:hypothetical protein
MNGLIYLVGLIVVIMAILSLLGLRWSVGGPPVATTAAFSKPDHITTAREAPYIEWGPIFAGAIAAAALSFLLLTFGRAIGLSLTSPWPDSGARLWVVALAVAWWAVAVQILSFAAGGYLAGRMRSRWAESIEEGEFRDSAHGFMVWAVGVLFGGLMLAFTSGAALKTATQSAATIVGGASAGAANALSQSGPVDYAVDLLLRPEPAGTATSVPPQTQPGPNQGGQRDDPVLRSEVGRIFTATIQNREFTERDRNYLVRLVQARTGLPEAEAQSRVDAAVNEARDLEIKARQQADKARRAAVITGFIAVASLLISLVAACYCASIGGRHRDEGRTPLFHGHRFWWDVARADRARLKRIFG